MDDGSTISKCLIFRIKEGEIEPTDQKTREESRLKWKSIETAHWDVS